VFAELHKLTRRKDDEHWFFQAKPHCGLFTDLPSSLKNWKNRFFILRSKNPTCFEDFPRSWWHQGPLIPKRITLNQEESLIVMELKNQAATQKFSCLNAVTAELHHWTIQLITGQDRELLLSDLGIGIFYISDLRTLAISLTFSLRRYGGW